MLKRSGRILLEWIAGAIGIGAILFALLFLRLAAGPLSLNDLASFMAEQLNDPARGITASVAHTELVWDNNAQQAELLIDGLVMKNSKDEVIATVPHAEAHVNVWPLFWGHIAFKYVRANGANIYLERSETGQLTFQGVEPQVHVKTNSGFPLSALLAEWPARIAGVQNTLEAIGDLSVTASRISILDAFSGKRIEGNLPSLTMLADAHGIVNGEGKLTIDTDKAPIDLTLNIKLATASGTGETTISFDNLNPTVIGGMGESVTSLLMIDAPMKGYINVAYMPGDAMQLTFDAASTAAGKLLIPNLPEPLAFDSIAANASAVATNSTSVNSATINHITIKRGDAVIGASGTFAMGVDDDKRNLDLAVTVSNLPANDVQKVWPVTLGTDARAWVVPNMRDGIVSKATFDLTGVVDWPSLDNFKVATLGGTMALDNMLVDYFHALPPLTQGKAEATYDDKSINIKVLGGNILGVAVGNGGTVDVTGLDQVDQNIAVNVPASGPVSDILTIVNAPPLEYLKKVGLQPKDMTGDASVNVSIALPLLNDVTLDQVQLKVDGKIKNFANATLVPVFKLTQGDLDLQLDAASMHITGPISANSARVNADWTEVFGPASNQPASIGKISAALTQESIQQMGTKLPGTITGAMPALITYKRFTDRPDQLSLDIDLAPVAFDFPRLTYTKAKGEKGKISAQAEINGGVISVTDINADSADMHINGAAKIEKDGTLSLLNLAQAKIGQNDVLLEYSKSSADALPNIAIKGKQLAVGALINTEPAEADADPQLYDANIDVAHAVFAAEDATKGQPEKFFAPFKVSAAHNADGWQHIDLDGMASGATPLIIKLEPNTAGQTLHMETADLGRVMHALDWTDDIIGGRMVVDGKSDGVGKPVNADIAVYDYRVLDLPFMARLLNALSLDGLTQLTQSDNGLEFKRLKGEMVVTGDELRFKNLRTSGGSLGLTAAGTINTATNQIDMDGTVVPFSSANKILGAIPIFGSLLTGGEGGGLFAATYSAKGNIQDPKFSVNPLAVLAPGFLRNIFFVEGD